MDSARYLPTGPRDADWYEAAITTRAVALDKEYVLAKQPGFGFIRRSAARKPFTRLERLIGNLLAAALVARAFRA